MKVWLMQCEMLKLWIVNIENQHKKNERKKTREIYESIEISW